MDEDGFVTDVSEKDVNENRKYVLQAAIVRIMKARKSMEHAQLVAEAAVQVSHYFKAQVPFVKKCIETLLDMGYLERDFQKPDLFRYVA